MRKFLIFCCCFVLLVAGAVTVFWDDLAQGYEDAVALAGEAATDSSKEMGRLSYHSVRCGKPEVMNEMQRVMDQMDQTSDFQASMRNAFYQGVEEAQAADLQYTEAYCDELAAALDQAQN